jgi:predicted molibdopterin-dependent oxidoreductase YjgC
MRLRRRHTAAAQAGPDLTGTVEILVDGRPVLALDGQSVAGALHAAGVDILRHTPVTGEPRGAFCGMGVCLECELTINGRPGRRACLTHVRAGLRVDTTDRHAGS